MDDTNSLAELGYDLIMLIAESGGKHIIDVKRKLMKTTKVFKDIFFEDLTIPYATIINLSANEYTPISFYMYVCIMNKYLQYGKRWNKDDNLLVYKSKNKKKIKDKLYTFSFNLFNCVLV